MKTYAPEILKNKISGASAGAGVALALLLDTPLGDMTCDCLAGCQLARDGLLGPFSPSFSPASWIKENLEKRLPENAHEIVSGRLHVSVTKVYDGKNMIINKFDTREELIEVILASCFIPLFSGVSPPRYKGTRVIDGGYSNNLPQLDTKTITVSPFSGSADICPPQQMIDSLTISFSNNSLELCRDNMVRMINILVPPSPDILAQYCKQGFDDCLRFLQTRNLVTVARCLGVATSYSIDKPSEIPSQESNMNEMTSSSTIPDTQQFQNVVEVFDKYIERVDKNYGSYIQENILIKGFFYPSLMVFHTLAWMFSYFCPILSKSMACILEKILYFFHDPTLSAEFHHARYICDINITQYGEESVTDFSNYADFESTDNVKDIFNLELVTDLQAESSPILPENLAAAIKFQKDNLSAAVASESGAPTRANSTRGSRSVSRVNSNDNLNLLTSSGVSGTMEKIKQVTDSQSAVMSFFFTDQEKEVKMLEIFDVTETDPSKLVFDMKSLESQEKFKNSRSRHCSAPTLLRRESLQAISHNFVPSRIHQIESKLAGWNDHAAVEEENNLDLGLGQLSCSIVP